MLATTTAVVSGLKKLKSERCHVCGESFFRDSYSDLSAEIQYPSKKWPDLLYAVGCPSLISARVLNDLKDAGINDFKTHPVELLKVPQKKLPSTEYWIREPIKEFYCETIVNTTDIRNKIVCKECGYWDIRKYDEQLKLPWPIFKLKEEFLHHNFIYARQLLCFRRVWSQKVIHLAVEKNGQVVNFTT